MDIRKITPCIECPRNCKPARFDENDSAKAASLLLVKAVEEEGSVTANIVEHQADADQIQRTCESRYTAKRALGAIGSCGTKIGAGECTAWQLDTTQPQIAPR